MNTIPEILTSSSAPDECHQVLNVLFSRWPEELSDSMSSALLDHFGHCRSCLRKWIALEAAADLASCPGLSDETHTAGVDTIVVRPADSPVA